MKDIITANESLENVAGVIFGNDTNIKFAGTKLRADYIQEMTATVQFRKFRLPIC
jgi:hypothetical protein